MAQVLDYSAGFPGAQSIKAAGYAGAVRYIGFPNRTKCTTRGELADFDVHGLGMALVYEDNANDWRGGEGQGAAAGRRARDHANAIGFPADRPIYMAVDQDVVTAAEFNLMLNYLRGAGSSLGGTYLTGVYGEADVIDRARDAGVATWFWQTKAWSHGRVTAAHLLQLIGTVHVGGIGCDVNDVLAPDWGQHNARSTDVALADDKLRFWNGATQAWVERPASEVLADLFSLVAGISQTAPVAQGVPLPAAPAWVQTLRQLRDVDVPVLKTGQTEILTAVQAGGIDPAAFAALVGPLIQAGATAEEVTAAAIEGVRLAFVRAGSTEGTTP